MFSTLKRILRDAGLFVMPTVVVCLVLLEVGLRLQGRLPSNTTEGIFDLHGTSSYRLKKSSSKVSRTPSFTCTINTNSLGFRDRAPGPRRLGPAPYWAFLGDSLTFGNGVEYEESFVGVLGELAGPTWGIEVLNLAVGGHHFADQAEQLYEFLETAAPGPARVVVVFTAPLVALFETPHPELTVRAGHLFEKNAGLGAYATVILGNTSSAYCFLRDGVRNAQARWFPSDVRVAQSLMEIFSKQAPVTRPEVAERLEARLRELDGRIRARGATPVYVYLPSSADLRSDAFLRSSGRRAEDYDFDQYRDLLAAHCERAGIQLVDLSPVLEREHARGERMSFTQDPHYTARVNRVIGQALYDALLGDPSSMALHPGSRPAPSR